MLPLCQAWIFISHLGSNFQTQLSLVILTAVAVAEARCAGGGLEPAGGRGGGGVGELECDLILRKKAQKSSWKSALFPFIIVAPNSI